MLPEAVLLLTYILFAILMDCKWSKSFQKRGLLIMHYNFLNKSFQKDQKNLES